MSAPWRRPRGRLRLPRWTIRLRLTLVFGALFLVAGAAVLAVAYLLAQARFTVNANGFFITAASGGSRGVVVHHFSTSVSSGATTTLVGGQASGSGLSQLAGPGAGLPSAAQAISIAQRVSGATLHQLLVDSGIALGLMGVISICCGWFVAGRALRPLRTITNTAQEISASSLHRRLALSGPDDELKQLGTTIDDLLGRLESAFEAQRRFVANASHELRTPLTLERALIEVALADPHPTVESLRAACEQVLAAGEQQERLIEALLTLSRSQRGLDAREPLDLRAPVEAALEQLEHEGLALETRLEPALTRGDARLVERLVTNLLANAVRYNRAGGRIEVRTETRGESAVLAVSNSGRPLAASELERIVRPFERIERDGPDAPEGLGLGLSIVEAIATGHGATLTLRPGTDGGLEVTVAFPALGSGEPGMGNG